MDERATVLERAELHLVDHWRNTCHSEHLLQIADVEVGDADRASKAECVGPLHSCPCTPWATLGPVDQVEVDVVDTEPPQALLSFGGGVGAARKELGGDEDLVTLETALPDPFPDALLVAIGLRGIDVAVPGLQRPADGADTLGAVGHLPDAEPQDRDLLPVGQVEHLRRSCRSFGWVHQALLLRWQPVFP
jgi:hypothetical protein